MIDVKDVVFNTLSEIQGVRVFRYFPNDFKRLPCVSYREANNAIFSVAEDAEYLSDIVYVVDVWGESDRSVTDIALAVDEKMSAIGFSREFSHDMDNPASAVRHKTMRFGIIQ